MLKCGLLGKTLSHSRSPEIHAQLGNYEYRLYEMPEEALPAFLADPFWHGLNVTIPYKKTVLPYLDELSPVAREIGSVNTIVRRPDGTLYGDNTDVFGFQAMVRRSGMDLSGQETLVLGSGGASVSVRCALASLGARPAVISRSGPDNYENLEARHPDAAFVVNTTPVGMFPHTDASPLDLTRLPRLKGVLDIIYNPTETLLMRQARSLGLPAVNGLYMLVAQACRSSELFTGVPVSDALMNRVYEQELR